MDAKIEAIAQADAALNNVGLPSYSELAGMLRESRQFMKFHKGNCFMRVEYIGEQDAMRARLNAALNQLPAAKEA